MNIKKENYTNLPDYLRALVNYNCGGQNPIRKHELVRFAEAAGIKLDSRASKDEYFVNLCKVVSPSDIAAVFRIGATEEDFKRKFNITHDNFIELVSKGCIRPMMKNANGKNDLYNLSDYYCLTSEEVAAVLCFDDADSPDSEDFGFDCSDVIDEVLAVLERASDEITDILNAETQEVRAVVVNALIENALLNNIE